MDAPCAFPGTFERPNALPVAKDLSHHLNRLTANRKASSLKELYKYMFIKGMISMAGGTPSPAYFPFESISANILPYDHLPLDPPRVPAKEKKWLLSWLFGAPAPSFTVPKWGTDPTDQMALQLSTALQYAPATGLPALPAFLRKYVETVYRPAYADWDVLLDVGSNDGFGKVCTLLLEFGDSILVEEWTYPGASIAYTPYELNICALKMDSEGILPEHMDSVLANWDEKENGRRPRVLYTVPTGQNPTGSTMLADRKKAIYDIAMRYDIIIVEDEPYYCLHMGTYIPRSSALSPSTAQQLNAEKNEGKAGNEAFLRSLPPSFLRFDTEGRVIRLDTFSKTSCPGSRLGWITTSPLFIERLTRIAESDTQAPSGFSTILTLGVLNTWGWDGYVRWLRGLKAAYRMRRDWLIDAFDDAFHLEFEHPGGNPKVFEVAGIGRGVTAYVQPQPDSPERKWDEKRGVSSTHGKPLVSFVPPSAGMFVFLAVHLDQHPEFDSLGDDATEILLGKLWKQLAEQLVLFAPGSLFDAHGVHNIGGNGVGYFRLSYSMIQYDQARTAVTKFAKVLVKFLEGHSPELYHPQSR